METKPRAILCGILLCLKCDPASLSRTSSNQWLEECVRQDIVFERELKGLIGIYVAILRSVYGKKKMNVILPTVDDNLNAEFQPNEFESASLQFHNADVKHT